MHKVLRWLPGALLLLYSCKIIDPVERIPSFIVIDSVVISPGSFGGFTDHAVTDIWAFTGTEFLGVFPLPARIPVLSDGQVTLQLDAGIFSDGIRTLRIAYPFYRTPVLNMAVNPGESYHITPVYTLPENIVPRNETLYEDFEARSILSFNKTGDSANFTFEVDSTTYLYPNGGNFSGLIRSKPGESRFIQISDVEQRFIQAGRNVFLEFNFASDMPFVVGVFASTSQGINKVFDLNLFPSPTWKKVYVNLTEEVGRFPNNRYRVFIEGQSAISGSYIAIDNIRLQYTK